MNNLYTREDQDTAAKTIAAHYRKTADLFPIFQKVFRQFDGKVYNCRLEKALQEATGKYIHTEWNYSGSVLHIEYYSNVMGRSLYLASLDKKDMADGKRLNAEKLIESAKDRSEDFRRRAEALDATADKVDDIRQQVKAAEKLIRGLIGSLPCEALDIWNLNYRIVN